MRQVRQVPGTGQNGCSVTRSLIPADYQCTRLLGFSQTNQWWPNLRAALADGGAKWELLWASGASIDHFADTADPVWSGTVQNAVGVPPDRVILNVSGDYISDVTYWVTQITAAIANIRTKYPTVRMIILQSNVAGPGATICPSADGNAVDGAVRTTWTNRYIRSAISAVSRGNVRGGSWWPASDCAAFDDYIGHLNSGYTAEVGAGHAAYYNANL